MSMGTSEERWIKYVMIVPLLLVIAFLSILPLFHLFQLAFSSYDFSKGSKVFNGLENFYTMMKDELFWSSLRITIIFVTVSVILEFFIGLGLAILVKGVLKLRNFIRTLFLVPMLVAPVAVGLVWKLIYRPDTGLINIFLRSAGLGEYVKGWLADPLWALPAVILVEIWQWTPFMFLFLLAGLESIPPEPYEAASIDGASDFQKLLYITLPLLKPAILTSLLLRTVEIFKVFDKLYILTAGGPGNITELITLRIYKVSFQFLELGYGAFLALITVSFIVVYNLIYLIIVRRMT